MESDHSRKRKRPLPAHEIGSPSKRQTLLTEPPIEVPRGGNLSPPPAATPPASQFLTNLIILCCHAIFLGGDPYDESSWRLARFQKSTDTRPGEHETFILHLEAALAALTRGSWSDNSLLVISGGHTSPDPSHPSESQSYLNAAAALAQATPATAAVAADAHMCGRLVLEEESTDSYQNVLFSVLAFRRHVGSYPKNIRVVTHAFKSGRILELHAAAIKWPTHRFAVHGINPPATSDSLSYMVIGEADNGIGAYTNDVYGRDKVIAEKRRKRGWDESKLGKVATGIKEKQVLRLLEWSRRSNLEGALFDGRLPWEEADNEWEGEVLSMRYALGLWPGGDPGIEGTKS